MWQGGELGGGGLRKTPAEPAAWNRVETGKHGLRGRGGNRFGGAGRDGSSWTIFAANPGRIIAGEHRGSDGINHASIRDLVPLLSRGDGVVCRSGVVEREGASGTLFSAQENPRAGGSTRRGGLLLPLMGGVTEVDLWRSPHRIAGVPAAEGSKKAPPRFRAGGARFQKGRAGARRSRGAYFFFALARFSSIAAWAAARRATGTR